MNVIGSGFYLSDIPRVPWNWGFLETPDQLLLVENEELAPHFLENFIHSQFIIDLKISIFSSCRSCFGREEAALFTLLLCS